MQLLQRANKAKSTSSPNKITNPFKNYSWQQDAALFGINWHKIKQKILKDNSPIEVMDGILHLFEEGKNQEKSPETYHKAESKEFKEDKLISSDAAIKTFLIKKRKYQQNSYF